MSEGRGRGSAKSRPREENEERTGDDLVLVEEMERVLHGEDLDGAESGVDMWVVARMGCEGAWSERRAREGRERAGQQAEEATGHRSLLHSPTSSFQQFMTHSSISSLGKASLCPIRASAVRPQ